jgi:hypothetical protein
MVHASLRMKERLFMIFGCIIALYAIFVCLFQTVSFASQIAELATKDGIEVGTYVALMVLFGITARIGLGFATLYPSFRLDDGGIRLRFLNMWDSTLYWHQIREVFLPPSVPGAIAIVIDSKPRSPWRADSWPFYRLNGTFVLRGDPVLLLFPNKGHLDLIFNTLRVRLSE